MVQNSTRYVSSSRPFAALAMVLIICISTVAARAQAWSPDGRKIVIADSTLVQVAADMLQQDSDANRRLPETPVGTRVPGAATGSWPAWSPDGAKLGYIAGGSRLMVLDLATQQASSLDAPAVSPIAWSPNSRFLAYIRSDEKGGLELRTLHANGDVALAVPLPFSKVAIGFMATIAWVPTTDNVIVAGGDGIKTDLYLIDQGQVVPLTTTGDVLGFAVSPGGDRVRWAMKSRNTHYVLLSIYDLQISKRTLSKLGFPDRLPLVNPQPRRSVDAVTSVVFSPDLQQIAFLTRGGPSVGVNGVSLYTADVLGRRAALAAKVTATSTQPTKSESRVPDNNAPPAPPALPAPVEAGSGVATSPQVTDGTNIMLPFLLPAFSPDNRQLAFVRAIGERRYLYTVRLDSNQRSIGLLP